MKRTFKKRLGSILMTLCMVLTMLPATTVPVWAADPPDGSETTLDVSLLSETVIDGTNWSYDSSGKVLTITAGDTSGTFTLTGTSTSGALKQIVAKNDVNLLFDDDANIAIDNSSAPGAAIQTGGNITFDGCTVDATSLLSCITASSLTVQGSATSLNVESLGAAGIVARGDITLSGGTVTVTAGNAGVSAISTEISSDGDILIEGGNVTATTLSGGSGSSIQADGSLAISGGTVYAPQEMLANAITISGGSVNGDSSSNPPQYGGKVLALAELTDLPADKPVTAISSPTGYGIIDVVTDGDGKLYFWLPVTTAAAIALTVDGRDYTGSVTPVPFERTTANLTTYNTPASEYNADDIAVINAIIDENGLNWGKADPADGSYVPVGWIAQFVTWSSDTTGKRIIRLSLENRSLRGTLDVSGLTELTELNCSQNQLSRLDVNGLTKLTTLSCYDNKLSGTLDVNELTELTTLSCFHNQLSGLNVSGLTVLTKLECSQNQLSGTLDVSELTKLDYLNCSYNQLSELDVNGLTELTSLSCTNNQLSELDVSELTKLTSLACSNNQLSELDVSELTKLTSLVCSYNQLSGPLDVSKMTALTTLVCSYNQLSGLDVSGLTKLDYLSCSNNQLSGTLDLSTNAMLAQISCDHNRLTGIELNASAPYRYINATDNYMTSSNVTGKAIEWNFSDFKISPQFRQVTEITNVPTTVIAGTPVKLSGTVSPSSASYKMIVWSIKDLGDTEATLSEGTEGTEKVTLLNTTAAGTVIVTATIANGVTDGDYTQDFTIEVCPSYQESEITGFAAIPNVDAGKVGNTTYGNAAAVIAALPTSVTANYSDDGTVPWPVTAWVDTDNYNPAAAGSYTFTATLAVAPTGFANSADHKATVEVVVGPADGGTIEPVPVITSGNGTAFTVGTAGSFIITADNSPTSFTMKGDLPSGVTFDTANGILSGTPAAKSEGVYHLIFIAVNGNGASAAQSFTLTVAPKGGGSGGGSGGGGSSPAEPGQTISDQNITTTEKGVEVDLTKGGTKLTPEQTASLISSNQHQSVQIVGEGYTITFPTGSMSGIPGQSTYDFGLEIIAKAGDGQAQSEQGQALLSLGEGSGVMALSFKHSGSLPGTASIEIKVGENYAGQTLYYYYYNPTTNKLEFRQAAQVDSKGYLTITQDRCSDYLLSTTLLTTEAKDRIWGQNRYLTAINIAEEYFKEGASTVILARGDSSADALPAVPLAKYYHAPLLLTPSAQLPAEVLEQLKALKAQKVILIGGTEAISPAIAEELKEKGLEVERIFGSNRYETAYEIAKRLNALGGNKENPTAILVNGNKAESAYADALSISPWAGYNGIPILYGDSTSNTLPKATAQSFRELNITRTILIGGTGVLPEGLEKNLPNPERYRGEDRFATNAAILKGLQEKPVSLYAATGLDYADALAVAAVAAQDNSWLILTGAKGTPEQVQNGLTKEQQLLLSEQKGLLKDFRVFGGRSAVKDETIAALKALIGK